MLLANANQFRPAHLTVGLECERSTVSSKSPSIEPAHEPPGSLPSVVLEDYLLLPVGRSFALARGLATTTEGRPWIFSKKLPHNSKTLYAVPRATGTGGAHIFCWMHKARFGPLHCGGDRPRNLSRRYPQFRQEWLNSKNAAARKRQLNPMSRSTSFRFPSTPVRSWDNNSLI